MFVRSGQTTKGCKKKGLPCELFIKIQDFFLVSIFHTVLDIFLVGIDYIFAVAVHEF